MRRSLLALLPLVAASPALGADAEWWWLGEFINNGARQEMYVDASTLKRLDKHRVEAWAYYVVEKPAADGEVTAATLQQVDCRAKTITYTARMSWDENGKQLGSAKFDSLPRDPIRANTSADVLRRYVCRDNPLPSLTVAQPIEHAMKMWGRAARPAETEEEPSIGYGTGFFVSRDGEMVTAYHVVRDADEIQVLTSDGTNHPARLVRSSEATDVAVLRVDHAPKSFLPLAPAHSSKPGDRVFTFGFPVIEMLGWEPKYTDGAISSLSGIGDEGAFAQISVPVQPGNSGGPLVNERGLVVGLISAQAQSERFREIAETLPQNVNWAVRVEYILPLIEPVPATASRSREEAIALARQSVALIMVRR